VYKVVVGEVDAYVGNALAVDMKKYEVAFFGLFQLFDVLGVSALV
jgi:hypothetical protein